MTIAHLFLGLAVVGILLAALWATEGTRPPSGLDSMDVPPPRGVHVIETEGIDPEYTPPRASLTLPADYDD